MLYEKIRGVIIPHAIYHYLYSILSIILLHIAGNSLLSTSMRPTLLLLSWIMKVTIDASTRLCVCILSITITTTGRITSGAKALTLLRDGWRGRKGFVRSASENMLGFIVYTVMTWVIWIDDTLLYMIMSSDYDCGWLKCSCLLFYRLHTCSMAWYRFKWLASNKT